MQPVVPRRNARPPIPVPGATGCIAPPGLRPTVQRRGLVRPRLWTAPGGYPADDVYVRRYWTAAIGAGAVADLLRLIRAAGRGRPIRRPVNLPALARAGLVVGTGETVWVRSTVPPVPPVLVRRMPPWLRQEMAVHSGGS